MLGWLLLVLVGLVGLFAYLNGNPEALSEVGIASLPGETIIYIGVGVTLVAIYIYSLSSDYRGRFGDALRHVAIWIFIVAGLVTGYAYRSDLEMVVMRVAGELMPPGQAVVVEETARGEHAVRLRKQPNGHFAVRASVNGSAMSLLVDTGASTVVLRTRDAERIGIDTSRLSFSTPVSTANGTTYAAPIRLKSISVGPIEMRDVEALVAKPGALNENLLGMTFLKRLRSYEFSGDFLTLRS